MLSSLIKDTTERDQALSLAEQYQKQILELEQRNKDLEKQLAHAVLLQEVYKQEVRDLKSPPVARAAESDDCQPKLVANFKISSSVWKFNKEPIRVLEFVSNQYLFLGHECNGDYGLSSFSLDGCGQIKYHSLSTLI